MPTTPMATRTNASDDFEKSDEPAPVQELSKRLPPCSDESPFSQSAAA